MYYNCETFSISIKETEFTLNKKTKLDRELFKYLIKHKF